MTAFHQRVDAALSPHAGSSYRNEGMRIDDEADFVRLLNKRRRLETSALHGVRHPFGCRYTASRLRTTAGDF